MRNAISFPVRISALVVFAAGCVACSTVYEGRYARDEGWRPGTVQELAPAAGIKQAGWRDCRKDMSAAQQAASRFATVEFFGSHRKSTITVPVEEGAQWSRGDRVYVDTADCNAGLQPRAVD
ncbi:hypothetical protein VVD49_00705 [Uliginosibacterium sp. H3]|uniref:Uncharacterized protein n=1 Tax=Uliginosibacterium silvisoli TaxID=3114758 RepID=A0ABU6JY73_9RHOO|nr:hypothetical protein [Uliginosibacterium sp. H3]